MDYPNIEAMASGTISGKFTEWPRVRPEAKALLAELAALREENARLLAERRELYDERGLLRAAVRKLLSFEASCGEQDIPEEDRIFARAVLAAAKGRE